MFRSTISKPHKTYKISSKYTFLLEKKNISKEEIVAGRESCDFFRNIFFPQQFLPLKYCLKEIRNLNPKVNFLLKRYTCKSNNKYLPVLI